MDASDTITTPEGRFTAEIAGPPGAPLVLMLHGFPQTCHTWRQQVPALARAGYRVVAPDQRGYSPGVRPAPTDLDEDRTGSTSSGTTGADRSPGRSPRGIRTGSPRWPCSRDPIPRRSSGRCAR